MAQKNDFNPQHIQESGRTRSIGLTTKITHVVAKQWSNLVTLYDNDLKALDGLHSQQGSQLHGKIVSYDWIPTSLKEGKIQPEKYYMLNPRSKN